MNIGFVPLIDAAPLILAQELGLFREEGLEVRLSREVGWGNIRDKLAYGHLNACHSLLGIPIQSALGDSCAGERIISIMSLGSGGDAITLAERYTFSGVNSAATLARYIRQSNGTAKPIFGHVFRCSMHHYLLRDWLASGGLNPDDDVQLCVLPPPQMASHMASGNIDGFCVGEPWNTLAQREGAGRIIALTTDILPNHPEKVLAVNQKWAQSESALLVPLIRAIIRSCAYCSNPKNHPQIAKVLSGPRYLKINQEHILQSLALDRNFGVKPTVGNLRASNWSMRSFNNTFPNVTHMAWLLSQMIRWGHVQEIIDPWEIAQECIDAVPYRQAAAELQINCPKEDAPPMHLRNGTTFAQPKNKELINLSN